MSLCSRCINAVGENHRCYLNKHAVLKWHKCKYFESLKHLQLIRSILEKGWSAKTTYCTSEEYANEVKSYGQCYVTARTLNYVAGWEILFNGKDGNNHYWNRLPCGIEVDFTSDQMGGDGIFPLSEMKSTGKIRVFKPLKDCKSCNPRLKRYLLAVEPELRRCLKN